MEKDPLSKNLFEAFENETTINKDDSSELKIPKKEPMRVVLRLKPFTKEDKSQKQDQGCINLKENEKVELLAPKDSFQFKSSIRGLADQTHEFSFSRVFNDDTTQKEIFDEIMLPFVKDLLDGQNGLVFTYGVTNSGKTYTIQGTPKDGGILPRALDVIFNSISQKMYLRANLKPKQCQDVIALSSEEEAQEDLIRNAIFHASDKENIDLSVLKMLNSTTKNDTHCSTANSTLLSNISIIPASKGSTFLDDGDITEEIKSRVTDATSLSVNQQGNVRFGMWVSFMEIYNELIYDLLDLTPIGKGRKRLALKLGDDKNGKPYVKGLREIFVTSSDEAYKVLRLGQKNRHIASTKLNQHSSRSHCIFNIKLLKIVDVGQPHVARISRLSIVDLAGSERYSKTGAEGDLLKQAGNINASIMTLGKCISILRYNQDHPSNQSIIPFRESKLTRLFQTFFLGKGKASMIVNISQCASVFDETYHVLKFSAVAKQIKMKAERATEIWKAPPLPKISATPRVTATPALNKRAPFKLTTPATVQKHPPLTIVTPATSKKRTLQNPSDFTYDELVNIVGELRDKVKKERLEKANLEQTIRKEVSQEMNELIVEIENSHDVEMMEQKHNLEDLMEKRLELLTKTVNKRKRKKMEDDSMEDSQVSFAIYEAEKTKVKERDNTIVSLQSRIREIEAEYEFFKRSHSPSENTRSKEIETLKKELDEAKETVNMQNEGIDRMQNVIQVKSDEIDKLREALDNDESSANNALVMELQQLLEVTTKELDNARLKLDNRDLRIKEMEKTIESQRADKEELRSISTQCKEWGDIEKRNEMISQQLKECQVTVDSKEQELTVLRKELLDTQHTLKDTDEACKTLQFENDEFTIKLEKYENSMKDHQTVLAENETFIEQLNKQVAELEEKLKSYEEKEEKNAENVKEQKVHESKKLKDELEREEAKVIEYGEKIERLEKQIKCYEEIVGNKTPAAKMKHGILASSIASNTPDQNAPSPFLGTKTVVTPVKKLNPTPSRSPYSPATKVSNQQLIKKLEKLLDEKTKELEKKASADVQKTNRIKVLEKQLSALEKKTAIKEFHTQIEALQNGVDNLKEQLAESEQKGEELNLKLTKEAENRTSLETQLFEVTEKYESTNLELQKLHNDYECYRKKHNEDIRHHEHVLQQAEVSNNKSRDRNEELTQKIKNVKDTNELLAKSIEQHKTEEINYKQIITDLQSSQELKTKKLEELTRKCEETDNVVRELTFEKERDATEIKKLTKELEDRRKSRVNAGNKFETALEGYEESTRKLRENFTNDIVALKEKIVCLEVQEEEQKNALLQANKNKDQFLEVIKTHEENEYRFEAEAKKLQAVNTKLKMKVNALTNEVSAKDNQLLQCENDLQQLKDQANEFSAKLKEKNKELLDLTKEKDKIYSENEKNFKNVLCLEKQKSESEAITASLQENSNKAKNNFEEIRKLKNNVSELQNTIGEKEREIVKFKTECELQEKTMSNFEQIKRENVELKETLALKEKELKRTIEEKKFALDELLKQTVKSKRKIQLDEVDSSIHQDSGTELMQDDTPSMKRKKKEVPTLLGKRITRSCKKQLPEQQNLDSSDDKENNSDTSTVQNPDKTLNELSEVSDEGRTEEEKGEEVEDDYFYAVSIALSPVVFPQSPVEESQNEIELVSINVGDFVALKEYQDESDVPIIAKVTSVEKMYTTVEMYTGGYNKIWRPRTNIDGELIVEKIQRSLVLSNYIQFTNSKRLSSESKRTLQKLYLSQIR